MKPDSLYNHGMKMLQYSTKNAQNNKVGWFRGGRDISYKQNSYKKKNGGYYYTLSFVISFTFNNDEVYFAHCYPYTYTDLRFFIARACAPKYSDRVRKSTLGKTLAGNDFESLIITNFTSDPHDIAARKCVVMTGRVHPGESSGSFMIEGMIRFLLSDDESAV